ncbi:hypothetical protein Tco_1451094 [Tanacetum coccineum]
MDRSFTLSSTEEADNVKILQSCNGLLLCGGLGMPVFDYVYNPSTNKYKKLLYPDCSLDNSPYYSSAGLRIAFDSTKSPHYKLVDAGRTFCDIDIQIYSSETDKWSICRDYFNYFSFDHFDNPDHPIITTIPIPKWGITFLKSYGYMDPMQILIQMSHLLHLEGKLFEWRGSLFLTVRYRVYTNHFMTPFPEGWSIRSNVWSIVLGEREQDLFLVIKLSRKVVQYHLISKNLHEIYDGGSNQLGDIHDDNDDDDCDNDELLQQFQTEHNVYEFIPSFESV